MQSQLSYSTGQTPPLSGGGLANFRWIICALLFLATTINYIDRQILSLLKETLDAQIGWTNTQFGLVNSVFQLSYALGLLGFGWFVDRFGTKIGYTVSIIAWSLAAAAHSLVGNVLGFIAARASLGLGEGGNFPVAVKAVALWFPRRERALATSIFNAGTNAGALIAPAVIPWLADRFGWQSAFIVAGILGFLWLGLWIPLYSNPESSKFLRPSERALIQSDKEPAEPPPAKSPGSAARLFSPCGRLSRSGYWAWTIGLLVINGIFLFLRGALAGASLPQAGVNILNVLCLLSGILSAVLLLLAQARRWHDLGRSGWLVLLNLVPLAGPVASLLILGIAKGNPGPNRFGEAQPANIIGYRQTWSFIIAKALTDPVWWFFLIWLPDYFKSTRGLEIKKSWVHIVTIYGIVTVLSILGGWITGYLTTRGWSVSRARKTAMLFFAFCVVPIVVVTRVSDWSAVALIGLAGAAHQAWSANLYTTVSDMFPKRVVAKIIGIGGMAGSLGGFLFPLLTGMMLDHFKGLNNATAGYAILFTICGCMYLVAFGLHHLAAPRFEPVRVD